MFNASVGPGDMSRKLLTMRRKLLLKMKDFLTSPMRKSESNFDIDALEFAYIKENYDKFCEGINSLKNYELEDQLTENVSAQYDKCFKLFQQSVSQVTKTSLTSTTSSALRRIELERKKAELSNLEEISRICKAYLLAKAEAEEAEAL